MTPKHLTRQEFASRLYRLMLEKGWRQSELARQANLSRDAISTYITGRVLPTPESLNALAKALDVEPEELLPNYVENARREKDVPSQEFRVSTLEPNKAWLSINRFVSVSTGVKILELLNNGDFPRIPLPDPLARDPRRPKREVPGRAETAL